MTTTKLKVKQIYVHYGSDTFYEGFRDLNPLKTRNASNRTKILKVEGCVNPKLFVRNQRLFSLEPLSLVPSRFNALPANRRHVDKVEYF